MKPKKFKAATRQAVPEAEEWVEELLSPLNSQVRDLTHILDTGIRLSDNLDGEYVSLSVKDSTDYEVSLKRVRAPYGAIMVYSSLYDYGHLKWKKLDNDRIQLAVKWDSSPTSAVDVVIYVFPK